MLFTWLKNRRRRKLLAEPFPVEWAEALQENVGHYALLPAALQERLRDIVRILIAEKEWVAARGLTLSDEMRVTVAAMAGILLLGQENFYFENVPTILLTPTGYKARRRHFLGGEASLVSDEELLGEANYAGHITVSWADALHAAREPGHGENLVFHEFAHKIDMLSGYADGTPPMPVKLMRRWQPLMKEEFEELIQAVEWDRETFLDSYGATDEGEFFAVLTEAFFDNPLGLRVHHAELYRLFVDFYGVNPAEWFA